MNKLIKVFDNIGFYFKIKNNHIIYDKKISNFEALQQDHVGYYIPYLCRNKTNNLYEIGVGETIIDDYGNIAVKRINIAQSSNSNNLVNFSDNNNEFYIFANQSIFSSSIPNVIVLDSDAALESTSAIYLVDCSISSVNLTLPQLTIPSNLVLEFKNISSEHNLIIKDYKGHTLSILNKQKTYTKLVSNNTEWTELYDQAQMSSMSSDDKSFNMQTLGDDNYGLVDTLGTGDDFSFQYKEGTDLIGSKVYWDNQNNNILLGDDNTTDAYTILATSGNNSTIFNNQKYNSDFIVNGSGNRNLFFSYDGRLGLNIPSGSRPSTIFHVVNTICQEGFRLENRNTCHPANITLYHKPVTSLTNNTVVGQINLAGKDSNGNRADYSVIESLAINPSSSNIEGGFRVNIAVGNTGISVIDTNNSYTKVGYSGNQISINRTGSTIIDNGLSNISVSPSNISISGTSISILSQNNTIGSPSSSTNIPGGVTAGSVISNSISSATMLIPGISQNSLLTIDNNNTIIGSPRISLNNIGTFNLPIPSNYLLQTTTSGAITGIYTTDDYLRPEGDIQWNKYTKRLASACLRQLSFYSPVPIQEFDIGDQLCIFDGTTTIYRTILSLDINNNNITGLIVDQNISLTDIENLLVYSVTKGGYLTLQGKTQDGVVSNSTSTVISNRPSVNTVFNTLQKDIDFSVYGVDQVPAIKVQAEVGQISIISGVYRPFATKSDVPVFPIVVTTGGVGISNRYASANFAYDISTNLFSGIVSDVGSNGLSSYYGTYDQNGNVAEWVWKAGTNNSFDLEEFAAGGDYTTPISSSLGASGLKSLELVPRGSGYAHIGFRIASLYNRTDPDAIVASNGLGMSFVGVTDAKNSEDSIPIYLRSGLDSFSPIGIDNLGRVDKFYRISKYEITNQQYCNFLNVVATTISHSGLYDTRMSTEIVGGIDRIDDEGYIYLVKPHMENKPVVFVNYINTIRFINWLHNNALTNIAEENIDAIIDDGAYTIVPFGNDTYNIAKSPYARYWLPDLNEWHKAAYFEPVDINALSGTSAVMIKRDDPHLVASGIDSTSKKFTELFANLSVSGWLYVDHIIVGDGTIRSSRKFTNIDPAATPTQPTTQEDTTEEKKPPSKDEIDDFIDRDPNAITIGNITSSIGTPFNATPAPNEEDVSSLCDDPDLISNNNTPWFCDADNTGPSFF